MLKAHLGELCCLIKVSSNYKCYNDPVILKRSDLQIAAHCSFRGKGYCRGRGISLTTNVCQEQRVCRERRDESFNEVGKHFKADL